MPELLVIKEFKGECDFLSNFYPCVIRFAGANGEEILFPNSEAVFQAAKYKAMTGTNEDKVKYVVSVAECKKPNDTKELGRAVAIDTAAWDAMKIDVMREVVRAKFEQNDFFQGLLLATGSAMLVEGNQHGDVYWGRCNGHGYNQLGVILMEYRGYLRWSAANTVV